MKCLVLSGGAEKGIGYIGLIKYLEQHNILSSIKTFYGTSVGAIISTLVSIGYSGKELEYVIKKMNIRDLLITDEFDLGTFLADFGFFEPARLIKLLELLIKKKTGIETITFAEHFQKYSKKLVITGSCLNNYTCYYFNHLDNPHMKLIDAIRISVSVPFLFKPVLYEDKLFVDGALFDNYPIQHALMDYTIDQILGCFININHIENSTIENVDMFLKICARSLTIKFNYLALKLFRECSVILDCDKLYYDFTSPEDLDLFIEQGYLSTERHFKARFPKQLINVNSISDKDIQL